MKNYLVELVRGVVILTVMAWTRTSFAAETSQPISMIPCTKIVSLQAFKAFSSKLKDYGVTPVDFTPENIMLMDEGESHPFYQFRDVHQNYMYDSCTGAIRFYRNDLNRPLTETEVKLQSARWLNEAEVKKKADAVKNVILPSSMLETFILNDRLGSIGKMENGIKTSKFLSANISIILYRSQQENIIGPSFLQIRLDRITGSIQAIRYENLKCGLDEADVKSMLAQGKGEVIKPAVLSFMDKWGLCQPVIVTGRGDQIQFLDLSDRKLKPIGDITYASQHDSKNNCKLVHNEEMLVPGDSLYFKPVVVNGTPLIYSAYFPRFEIKLETQNDSITLTGLLPKTGKKAELTLGKTAAMLDGKPITLAAPPKEIEGRLYLPYELLTLCNGVLTRWDSKKNTLWVDTRYLRR